MAQSATKNDGAIKAGREGYFFRMEDLKQIDAGPSCAMYPGTAAPSNWAR